MDKYCVHIVLVVVALPHHSLEYANPETFCTGHSKLAQSLYPHPEHMPEHMPGRRSTENEAEGAKTCFKILFKLEHANPETFCTG